MSWEWYQSSMSNEKAARWRFMGCASESQRRERGQGSHGSAQVPHAIHPEAVALPGEREAIRTRRESPRGGGFRRFGADQHVAGAAVAAQLAGIAVQIGAGSIEVGERGAAPVHLAHREGRALGAVVGAVEQ